MKCSECEDWEAMPNSKNDILYGICNGTGEIIEVKRNIAYEEEVTRHGSKTRPWHVCDKDKPEEEEKVEKKPEKKKSKGKGWSTRSTLDTALAEIREAGVPIPKAIEGMDREDIFPSTNSMTEKELGSLLFKYGALKGYVMWLLFQVETEYNNVHNAKVILQGEEVHKLEINSEKKRLKEGLEAMAISNNEILNKLAKREIQLEAKVSGFKSLLDIYSSHWSTVSREIARRSDEIQSGLRQANLS